MQRKLHLSKSKTGKLIIDRHKQMGRWEEHYLELYIRENSFTQEALDAIKEPSVLEELLNQLWTSSTKQLVLWPVAKHLVKTSFRPRSSKAESQLFWNHFTNSCVSDERRQGTQDMLDAKLIAFYKIKRGPRFNRKGLFQLINAMICR